MAFEEHQSQRDIHFDASYDYYADLEVSPLASAVDITRKYRELGKCEEFEFRIGES